MTNNIRSIGGKNLRRACPCVTHEIHVEFVGIRRGESMEHMFEIALDTSCISSF